jgi:hypothetical protein
MPSDIVRRRGVIVVTRADNEPTEPFRTAAAAWFWAIGIFAARRDGARSVPSGRVRRPCESGDIIRALDRLYQTRDIDLRHVRVLRDYGERRCAPNPLRDPRIDARLWTEAIDQLAAALRLRGIVRDAVE